MGAKDGETGVELAMRHRPDLIICDIMMPQMDGYGVLTKLRSQEKTLSIPFYLFDSESNDGRATARHGVGC